MAQSFLDMQGLPLGLRNNNPGNLRPLSGNQKWAGEIAPDNTHGFSRFQDVAFGLRAMITSLTGDIVSDGYNTLRKLISKYAPSSENNTNAYINAVSSYTGWNPDQVIAPSQDNIAKLVRGMMNVELGISSANLVTHSDIYEAMERLSDKVKSWLNFVPNSSTDGLLVVAAIIALAAVIAAGK